MAERAIPRAGQFRAVITIQYRTTSIDTHGGQSVAWATLATVRGKVESLAGNEAFNADQPTAQRASMVTIWYRSDVTPRHRLTVESRTLEIVSVSDPDGGKRLLQLTCVERA